MAFELKMTFKTETSSNMQKPNDLLLKNAKPNV